MEFSMDFKRVFNDDNLNAYLIKFDPMGLKYGVKKTDKYYDKVYEYEKKSQPTDYTRKDSFSFIENTNLVYGGDDKESTEFLWRYRHIVDKLLDRYVHIVGLSRLFDERFIEFEWDMHSRMDFNNHTISYYRDHFIHQLRDCYMILSLLDDIKIYEKVKVILHNRSISKVSRYFSENITQLSYKICDNKRLDEILHEIYDSKYNSSTCSYSYDDFVIDHYTKYIIYASSCIAALFHDIGYPVVHYFGYQKRLLKFAPSIYMLINGDKSSAEKIAALLSQSLLFQVVGKEKILYCEDENHGAFSAITLLLHFYESGLIYSLPQEQKVAVELAALAIFNHTNQYEFIKGEKHAGECNYYRAQFNINPISYLLRLCDDAQEWERTYFEISNTSTLVYCSKCLTPIKKQVDVDSKKHKYICECGENKNETVCFRYESTEFDKRVIYNVTPSRSLEVYDNGRNSLVFSFDYDYFSLLRMCAINPTYARQRAKELNYIKKLVLAQDIGYKNGIRLEFFMSNNPIYIKSKMIKKLYAKYNISPPNKIDEKIGNFLSKCTEHFDKDSLVDIFKESLEDLKKSIIDVSSKSHMEKCDVLLEKEWCKKQILFYYLVGELGEFLPNTLNRFRDEIIKKEPTKDKEYIEKKIYAVIDNLSNEIYDLYIYLGGVSDIKILKLLRDTLYHFSNNGEITDDKYWNSERYNKQYNVEDAMIFELNGYCNEDDPINHYKNSFCLDYYSDLYIFECINNLLKES